MTNAGPIGEPQASRGRVVLITGASRGIGEALARGFAGAGARCVLAARDARSLERIANEISGAGGDAKPFPVDLSDKESVLRLTDFIKKEHGHLDVLIANAARDARRAPLAEYLYESWLAVFQVNVHANFLLIQGLDPLLRKSPSGRVILVSSGVARHFKSNTGAYAVSKAALEAIARIYAQEIAATQIRVNIVAPGPTRTEMRAAAFPQEDPNTVKPPEALLPLFFHLASHSCEEQGSSIVADEWLKSKSASASHVTR